jgi:signal transduction histidine kinase
VSADDLLQYLTWAVYGAVFVAVAVRTVRLPTRAHADMALFFGAVALLILLGAAATLAPTRPLWLSVATAALLLALPWLLLRLVAEFATVPPWLTLGAPAGWLLAVAAVAALPPPLPPPAALLMVAYFVALMGYDAWALLRAAARAAGVTRRRLRAAALGSGCLAAVLAFAGLGVVFPAAAEALALLGRLAGLASGPCYLVGFAPPAWLRRAWQEPELRAYLDRAGDLAHLPDAGAMARGLEDAAAAALGATGAGLGLWDAPAEVLRFLSRAPGPPGAAALPAGASPAGAMPPAAEVRSGQTIAGRAFAAQRPVLAADAPGEDPAHASLYRAAGIGAVLAAPVTSGARRLGVLAVYARRAPVFAAGDLELLRLLADQAAVVLERRALLAEVAAARAREEADRLKDEFLAGVSHDLRNPLAAARGTAQVLARRLERRGTVEPAALAEGLAGVVAATGQMAALIDELLDVARLRSGRPLVLERRPADLVALARRTVAGHTAASERHRVRLEAAAAALPGSWDEARLERVLQNLLNNALKYSPDGGEVVVRVWREPGDAGDGVTWAAVAVRDRGVGIPAADLPHVFEPFRRGANVEERIRGTGLGLAAARQIVEQHGGRLTVESREGQGSTFTVWLPLGPDAAPLPAPAPVASGERPRPEGPVSAPAVPPAAPATGAAA